MFLKGIALVAIFGFCQAAEHAYSSQSIVLHHVQKEHDHGHKGEDHVPVKVEVKKAVPVVKYVVKSVHEHKQEYKHEEKHEHKEPKYEHHEPKYEHHEHKHEHHEHKPAISSQHIERHDIPAHPPKGWNEHHGPAKYEFEYKVQDPHTHDNKYQHEARDGHSVKGVYSLHEADGSVRTVHYSADKKAGFQADVKHTTKHVEEHKKHH